MTAEQSLTEHRAGEPGPVSGTIRLNARGYCSRADSSALRILGERDSDVRGRHIHDLIHGGSSGHDRNFCPLWRGDAGTVRKAGRHTFIAADGKRFDVLYSLALVQRGLADAHVLRFIEATPPPALTEGSVEHQSLELLDDAVIVTDLTGKIVWCNSAAEVVTGSPAAELIGTNALDTPRTRIGGAARFELLRSLLAAGRWAGHTMLYPYRRAPHRHSARVSFLRDTEGRTTGCVAIIRAPTPRRERERDPYVDPTLRTLERITDGFMLLDLDWRVIYINPRGMDLIGGEQLRGKRLTDAFDEFEETEFARRYTRALHRQEPEHFEAFFEPHERWYEVHAYPSEDGLTIYFRDATKRKEAERLLLDASERFDLVTRATRDLIFDWDIFGRQVWRSGGIEQMLRYKASEMRPAPGWWLSLVHPADRHSTTSSRNRFLTSNERFWSHAYRVRRADGTYAHVLTRAYAVRDAEGRAVRVIGAVTDLSSQKEVEAELEDSRQQLAALSQRLLISQEEERTRIARDLHDQLGQSLTLIKYALSSDRPGGKEITSSLIDKALEQVRSLSLNLRPPILDELGLTAALDTELRRFQTNTGIETSISSNPPDVAVPQEAAVAIFRIVQEALTNAARHSGASRIVVRLVQTSRMLHVSVQDDGRGIGNAVAGLGIVGMTERARALHGRLTVTGAKEPGTIVSLRVPLGRRTGRQ